jgi:membrane associated rhomboid family serine protease
VSARSLPANAEDSPMGIYDREYYRREGPSFLRAIAEQGTICKWLIGINVALFVLQLIAPTVTQYLELRPGTYKKFSKAELEQYLDPHLRQSWGDRIVDPVQKELWQEQHDEAIRELEQRTSVGGVLNGFVWQLLTYAFVHSRADLLHILFNMIFLWWFGHEVEELYGPREFLTFYLVAAFLGGVAYCLWSWARGTTIPCVGASGAVMAVLILYACHYPRRIIYVMWFLPVPIWLFALYYFASDAYSFLTHTEGNVAVTVHLAGALFGFAYYKRAWRLYPIVQSAVGLVRGKPRLRVLREEEPTPRRRPAPISAEPASTAVTTAPPKKVDEQLEAKVDAVLEKVARHGRDSLSESEKELLMRASEVYKRRKQP